jgi:hypothetical protein
MTENRVHTTDPGCLSEATLTLAGVMLFGAVFTGLAVASINAENKKPSPIPSNNTNCLVSGSPLPSERVYASTLPDGSRASITVFNARTCPPNSR